MFDFLAYRLFRAEEPPEFINLFLHFRAKEPDRLLIHLAHLRAVCRYSKKDCTVREEVLSRQILEIPSGSGDNGGREKRSIHSAIMPKTHMVGATGPQGWLRPLRTFTALPYAIC